MDFVFPPQPKYLHFLFAQLFGLLLDFFFISASFLLHLVTLQAVPLEKKKNNNSEIIDSPDKHSSPTTRPKNNNNRPLLSDLFNSFGSLLLVLLFSKLLLSSVALHSFRESVVILSDGTEKPIEAVLDGSVALLTVAGNCRTRLLSKHIRNFNN